jgi:hypothetical protein
MAMMKWVWVVAILALGGGWSTTLEAAVPSVIPYQGRLTDAAGTPLNGSYSIRFSLWNSGAGGSEQWSETQAAVTVSNGLFQVNLGSVVAIPATIFTGGDLYLEIKVGADPAMTPRQRFGSTPYAFRAGIGAGLASGYRSNVTAAGTENLVAVTVTFPASGYALVTGYGAMGSTIPAASSACYGISISDVSAAVDGSNQVFNCQSNWDGASHYFEGNSSTQRAYQVVAGARTFYLVGQEQIGTWTIYHARMNVEYFPDAIGSVTEEGPQERPGSGAAVGNRRVEP